MFHVNIGNDDNNADDDDNDDNDDGDDGDDDDYDDENDDDDDDDDGEYKAAQRLLLAINRIGLPRKNFPPKKPVLLQQKTHGN